jgi:hypothetical protein
MTDFINLKIKPTQSSKDIYRGRIYKGVNAFVLKKSCIPPPLHAAALQALAKKSRARGTGE